MNLSQNQNCQEQDQLRKSNSKITNRESQQQSCSRNAENLSSLATKETSFRWIPNYDIVSTRTAFNSESTWFFNKNETISSGEWSLGSFYSMPCTYSTYNYQIAWQGFIFMFTLYPISTSDDFSCIGMDKRLLGPGFKYWWYILI